MTNQLNISPVVDIQATITDPINQETLVLTTNPDTGLVIALTPVIKGDKGDTGDYGVGTFVASQNISKGMPVYVLKSNGQLGLADSAFYTRSFIIGYATEDVLTGFTVDVNKNQLTLTDWTTVAKTTTLAVGQTYFLDVNGGITTTAPALIPAAATATVGVALTANTLNVSPTYPILL